MTLKTCKILLKQFEAIANGEVEEPKGHAHWADVKANAKVRATLMRERIAKKEKKLGINSNPGIKKKTLKTE